MPRQSSFMKTKKVVKLAPLEASKNQHRNLARERFRLCSHRIALAVGTPWAFLIALACIVVWAALGPVFHFSDTWQLVVNTATTIVTFLMVFVIQNTQNRDSKAIHLKLDELLRGLVGPRTSLVDLEDLSEEELDKLQHEFERVRGRACRRDKPAPAAKSHS